MNSNKKIDNLLSSILFRLESFTNSSKEIKESIDSQKIKWYSKIPKYMLNIIVTFLLIVPTTFNINNLLNAENSKTDYKINNLSTQIPTELYSELSKEHQEQIYEHTIDFSGKMNVFSRRIKKLFFIYTKYDNSKINEQAFHPISLSVKRPSLKTYIGKSIPFSNFYTSSLPLFTSNFDCQIYYHSSKQTLTKPIYVLAIDNDNHFTISIILMKSKSITTNKMITDDIMSSELQVPKTNASFNFMTSSQILESQDYQKTNKIPISIEQFKNDTSQIQTIFRQYFSTD